MSRKSAESVQRGWGVQVLIVVVFGFLAVSMGWMAAAQIDPVPGMGPGMGIENKPGAHLAGPGMGNPDMALELPGISSSDPALGQLTQR